MPDSAITEAGGRQELRARDLERLLEERIVGGVYPPGTRLPTVRELGHTYRVNKNTAARAYQALERRGLIDVARGRGVYVRESGELSPMMNLAEQGWAAHLQAVIDAARDTGMSRGDLLERITSRIDAVYGPAGAQVVFIECNNNDLQSLAAELSAVTDVPFDQVLLEDALTNPIALGRSYDLIVTTFQHLGALRQAVPAAARHKVVGVNASPNHDSLLDLARTHVASYAIVCDTPSTIESLAHLVSSYNPGATVLPAMIDDAPHLRRVLTQADTVVVTQSCRRRLPPLGPDQTLVTIYFTIDQQSIDFLRRRLTELSELAQREPLDGPTLRSAK